MGLLAAYSIKTALLLSVMYAVYMLSLSGLKDASLRRAILLSIFLLSFILPLIDINIHTDETIYTDVTSDAIELPTIITDAGESLSKVFKVIAILIISGMILMVLISLYTVITMSLMSLRAKTIDCYWYRLKVIEGKVFSPFCFCGRIYISENEYESISDMILAHEMSHIRHHHFLDLIIIRVMLILQWWNPFCWLMVREVQQVHEYQADADVLKAGYDSKEYQYLLLNRAVGRLIDPFASNGFKQSKLKNRLKMINRNDSGKIMKMSTLLLIPGAVAAFMLLSTPMFSSVTDSISKSLNNAGIESKEERSTDEVADAEIPKKKIHYKINGELVDQAIISRLKKDAIEAITVYKDNVSEHPDGLIDIELKYGYSLNNALEEAPISH